MKKLMFVCLGNICRSPLAHTIFEELARKKNYKVEVDSSGVGNWHAGELPDERMRNVAKTHGYNMNHLAKQITKRDLKHFDYIFVMAKDVRTHLFSHFDPSFSYKDKVYYFRYQDAEDTSFHDVPDPFYEGQEAFEEVFQIVEKICQNILDKMIAGNFDFKH